MKDNNIFSNWSFIHAALFIGVPSNGLKMEIVFKRRLTNELLTTYLPSFFLLLMSYATTFYFLLRGSGDCQPRHIIGDNNTLH